MLTRRRKRCRLRFPNNSPGAISLKVYSRPRSPGKALTPRLRFILLICFTAIFVLSATMLIRYYASGASKEAAFKKLAAVAAGNAETPVASPISSDPAEQPSTSEAPIILEQYNELYKQNSDMVGWVRIDGTTIDYPVMYTGDDFYLGHGFDKEESKSGVPFIDKRCSVEPMGTNTIIYGIT